MYFSYQNCHLFWKGFKKMKIFFKEIMTVLMSKPLFMKQNTFFIFLA
ncbi:hypothetical protein EfmE980_2621 [Enterococcus faecium E980]|nr:hypothetical protein EfmE980_2621 [Enterococcus faecium E980]